MKEIIEKLKKVKQDEIAVYCFPIKANGQTVGRLRPITNETIQNTDEIKMLTEWRRDSSEWFTTQFPVTEAGTRDWLNQEVLQVDNRMLFYVDDVQGTPIGQVGFRDYDPVKRVCEFDNLIRGEKGGSGDMILYALIALGVWSMKFLDLHRGYLKVLANNVRASHIYEKLGFEEIKRVPLKKTIEDGIVRWIPDEGLPAGEEKRQLVTMMIRREVFEILFKQNL